MTSSLGFVVLARRPGQPPEPVSAVFPAYPNGLEQAQNVIESCQKRSKLDAMEAEAGLYQPLDRDPVVYVIGEITERTP